MAMQPRPSWSCKFRVDSEKDQQPEGKHIENSGGTLSRQTHDVFVAPGVCTFPSAQSAPGRVRRIARNDVSCTAYTVS